jgi:hypothetical protein
MESSRVEQNIAIHEVYGGNYVRFLWVKDVPSKVRKLIG